MTVYLLHLQQPMSRGVSPAGRPLFASHYIGYSDRADLGERLVEHMTGRGAKMLAAAARRGIAFQLARVWHGPQATRTFERRLKNCKNASDYCPVCSGARVRDYHPREAAA